jgi:hypothetical protein
VISNLTVRNSTSVGIIEARNQPETDTELLLEEVDIDQVLRSLTGLSASRIAAGVDLADEWD